MHLWSVINRIRTIFDTNTSNWFINSRDPVGYYTAMNMSGPANHHLYVKEAVTPNHIKTLEEEMRLMTTEDVTKEYSSYVAFRLGLMAPSKKLMINVDEMATRNKRLRA
jgi:hypothetical protein